jgi:hypothetical protein
MKNNEACRQQLMRPCCEKVHYTAVQAPLNTKERPWWHCHQNNATGVPTPDGRKQTCQLGLPSRGFGRMSLCRKRMAAGSTRFTELTPLTAETLARMAAGSLRSTAVTLERASLFSTSKGKVASEFVQASVQEGKQSSFDCTHRQEPGRRAPGCLLGRRPDVADEETM